MDTIPTNQGGWLILILDTFEFSFSNFVLPKDNMIGTLLLIQLLDAKLEAAGQLRKPTTGGGALNQSDFVCSVEDAYEAAKVICELLEKVGLLLSARIYRLDADGLIWRHLHPPNGKDFLPEDLNQQMQAHLDLGISKVKRAAEEFQKFKLQLSQRPQSPS